MLQNFPVPSSLGVQMQASTPKPTYTPKDYSLTSPDLRGLDPNISAVVIANVMLQAITSKAVFLGEIKSIHLSQRLLSSHS